ncbi:MAG: hypothetical protein OQK99_10480 [Gammaproteobacteria bacterium]|nr:hypothetical protein [Gammaproteobacteria bacterium]
MKAANNTKIPARRTLELFRAQPQEPKRPGLKPASSDINNTGAGFFERAMPVLEQAMALPGARPGRSVSRTTGCAPGQVPR